jgi:hypothetical protein
MQSQFLLRPTTTNGEIVGLYWAGLIAAGRKLRRLAWARQRTIDRRRLYQVVEGAVAGNDSGNSFVSSPFQLLRVVGLASGEKQLRSQPVISFRFHIHCRPM